MPLHQQTTYVIFFLFRENPKVNFTRGKEHIPYPNDSFCLFVSLLFVVVVVFSFLLSKNFCPLLALFSNEIIDIKSETIIDKL